jgi:hemin uptake protein HemP
MAPRADDDSALPPPAGRGVATPARPPAPARPSGHAAARVTSEQLFGGAAELEIEHRGALYRLKQTALGKLILTK